MKLVRQGRSGEVAIVKNQLCAAIGVVKMKSAAIQYKVRIAELQAAGADVGDFGHSRKMFPAMIEAAYKSTNHRITNHRITNQVTFICPVVNGSREGIVLDAREVYASSDATGGTACALAAAIFKDLDEHVGIKGNRFLQAQGRVMDGQYHHLLLL
ncbi:Hypothetical predicted protein [Paramuricea clavata]|uniref:Uncharacterized protein n=1 Tax=Paramuricea clavata TaxID=317549 RepID=A0A7D9E8U2_PARCT|nr:Hypothetical predicted protein [Paramuricea clavata]